jgi:flagellar assembly protein FliH
MAEADPVAEVSLSTDPASLPDTVAQQASAPEPETVDALETALSSEAVLQQIESARAEAYAQALDIGRSEGRDAERPLARQQGYDEGFATGVAQAKAESQTEVQKRQQQEHQAMLDRLQSVIDNLQQLAYNPDAMFEPMKKFAIYLAEQLVRGELVQSPQAISRLIDNALRELNASGDKAVIIHLHPEDLEAYRPTVASFGDSLILRPDSMLERGSVRVSLDGSVVEDLMQRRIEGVKKSLAQAPAPSWRAGGSSLASRVQQGQAVDDVTIVDQGMSKDKALESTTPADGHA